MRPGRRSCRLGWLCPEVITGQMKQDVAWRLVVMGGSVHCEASHSFHGGMCCPSQSWDGAASGATASAAACRLGSPAAPLHTRMFSDSLKLPAKDISGRSWKGSAAPHSQADGHNAVLCVCLSRGAQPPGGLHGPIAALSTQPCVEQCPVPMPLTHCSPKSSCCCAGSGS